MTIEISVAMLAGIGVSFGGPWANFVIGGRLEPNVARCGPNLKPGDICEPISLLQAAFHAGRTR